MFGDQPASCSQVGRESLPPGSRQVLVGTVGVGVLAQLLHRRRALLYVLLLLLAVRLQQVGLGHTVLQRTPATAQMVRLISRLRISERGRTSKRSTGGSDMQVLCTEEQTLRCSAQNPVAAAMQ